MTLADLLVEYADPELYDLENHEFDPDGSFLMEYAKEAKGPVLELGCGTGRITIPLAQSGIDITGLDIMPAMIERGKQKAGNLPIQWILGDVRTYRIERKFHLIFETGSVFQHLLTLEDQEAFFGRAGEHLDINGSLIVSIRFPHPDLLMEVLTEKEWYSYKNHDGTKISVSGIETYDPVRQVKVETAYRRWSDSNGTPVVKEAPLSLRTTYPQEMLALIHYNGFKVDQLFGDFDRSPLTAHSRSMIFVCRKNK